MEAKNTIIGLLLVCLLLSCLALGVLGGAVAGGLTGYFIGRQEAQAYPPLEPYPMPMEPGMPPEFMPPSEEPPFEMPFGAIVQDVEPGSPADEAGLRPGDLIVAVDDEDVGSDNDLADLIGEYEPGDKVDLTIIRQGRERTIRVKLGRHPEDRRRAYLGITYAPMGPPKMRHFER